MTIQVVRLRRTDVIQMLQYLKIIVCPNRIFLERLNRGVRASVKDKLKPKES